MPVGAWVVPNLARLNLVNATTLANLTAANYRLALVTSSWTPNNATDELWSAASANEIANGNGYTTGGVAPASITLSQSGGVVTFTMGNAVWTASGTGIPVWRRAVLYYLGTVNSKVNPLIAHFLGDDAPADIPVTTSGNTLTVQPNASGVIRIS